MTSLYPPLNWDGTPVRSADPEAWVGFLHVCPDPVCHCFDTWWSAMEPTAFFDDLAQRPVIGDIDDDSHPADPDPDVPADVQPIPDEDVENGQAQDP